MLRVYRWDAGLTASADGRPKLRGCNNINFGEEKKLGEGAGQCCSGWSAMDHSRHEPTS